MKEPRKARKRRKAVMKENESRIYFIPCRTQIPDEWKLGRDDYSGDY